MLMPTLQARQQIRECKDLVLRALGNLEAVPQLETIYFYLDEMEDCLTLAAIEEKVTDLATFQEKLASVAGEIEKDIKGLQEVTEKVAKVVKVVKIFTDVGKQAATLGA